MFASSKMDRHQPFYAKPFQNQSQCLAELVLVRENSQISLVVRKNMKHVVCVYMTKRCHGTIGTHGKDQSRMVEMLIWLQK